MMLLAPGWVLLAVLASAVVAAIHLIAWQLPRAVPLPTARFVPDEPARRAARAIRPSDLALLALRIAILMVAGLALAKPVVRSTPSGTATVIAMEHVADTSVLRNSLMGVPRGERTVFIVFDTTARVVSDETGAVASAADSVRTPSLTVGLLAAIREARILARDYENVDIALVSTFDRRAFDAATADVRNLWPDTIRTVRLPVIERATGPDGVEIAGDLDDPVVAGIRLAEANNLIRGSARVSRTSANPGDSAFATGGGVAVVWPRANNSTSQRVDGVHTDGATAIGHFVRGQTGDSGRVVARWVDGSVAAIETLQGNGCIRTIGFDVPDVGDFAISAGFQRLAAELLAPCLGKQANRVAPDSLIAGLVSPALASSIAEAPDEIGAPNRLAAALMSLAVLLAAAEIVVRRRSPSRTVLEVAA